MRELCNKEVTFHVTVVVVAIAIAIAWLFLGSDCLGTTGRIA